jgi:hypothetical protein
MRLSFYVLNKFMHGVKSVEYTRRLKQSLVTSTMFYTLALMAANLLLWTASLNKSYVCSQQ